MKIFLQNKSIRLIDRRMQRGRKQEVFLIFRRAQKPMLFCGVPLRVSVWDIRY